MWKDILKAPPFDAVRYERQVSTPRQMTFPSFFSQVLDTYIENAIKSKRFRNPSKSEKRKYIVYFRNDDVEKYRKYLDNALNPQEFLLLFQLPDLFFGLLEQPAQFLP